MVSEAPQRLLVVGPLPPPIAGTSVSFQIFCDLLHGHPDKVEIDVINSAPKKLGQYPLFSWSHLQTAQRIVHQFIKKVGNADQVLIFGPDQFLMSMGSICIQLAKLAGKPCYVRSFGGSLDRYYAGLRPAMRKFFHLALRRADGLIVETELLHSYFTDLIGQKVHYVPGYRPLTEQVLAKLPCKQENQWPLRAVFVGHIREEKGVFVLLESLRLLGTNDSMRFQCDFYGPIYDAVSQRFLAELAQTPTAKYRGILAQEEVIPTLGDYDLLIFPSHYAGEGHPGVVIEAMMAGIPVITTRFRSIPEIIHHGENGLLIEPGNVEQLGASIQDLIKDRSRLTTMGQKNWAIRTQFSATWQISRILQPLGIQI